MTGKHLLSEIVAGLDGVTDGPWNASSNSVDDFGREYSGSLSFEFISNHIDDDEQEDADTISRIAAHIARLSPDRIRAIASYVEQLEKALEPFANEANKFDPPENDDDFLTWATTFTIGDLRRARAALKSGRSQP